MKQINKIISLITLGIILFSIAYYLEFSISNIESDYIKLGGVTFHTSIEPGIREAKNQSKPVFLYFRSQTCYWCIVFENEALSDNKVIDLLNKEFVLISIDTFKQKNTAKNLNVRTTPYMIFFDKDGKEISRIPGYIPREEFLVKLNETLERLKD
ncbi:MAG TPA: thioredoxin family protein [Candidatus Limnocylindrales bacterium]|nr:thioredoxin family protein [Candidatus Limnocylindrales bacterium]